MPKPYNIQLVNILAKQHMSYNDIKLQQQKNCFDCGDAVGLAFKVYQNRKYCEECYANARNVCDLCKKEEKDVKEFFPARIEEDGLKIIMICVQCSNKLQACEHSNCNVYFKKKDKRCEQCDGQYCKIHEIDHKCKTEEPRHIFRRPSGAHCVGNPDLAKEIKIPWMVGIELEAVNGDPNILRDKLDIKIGLEHDGSLEGRSPVEIILPPASNDKLEMLVRHTAKISRNAGYKVNKTCGMHVHFDMTKERNNAQLLFRMLSTYYALEPVIFEMLPKSRRNNKYALPLRNWFGEAKMLELTRKPLPPMEVLEMLWYKSRNLNEMQVFKGGFRAGIHDMNPSRYHGFNLHAFFSKGTLEMRYHHGTLNKTKIMNWINLHLMILNWVKTSYDQNVVDAIFFCENPKDKFRLMCRHMKFPKVIRRYVMRNIRKFEGVDIEDKD